MVVKSDTMTDGGLAVTAKTRKILVAPEIFRAVTGPVTLQILFGQV